MGWLDILHTLLFADYQNFIAGDEHDADYLTRKLTEIYNKAGLEINLIFNRDATYLLQVDGKVANSILWSTQKTKHRVY